MNFIFDLYGTLCAGVYLVSNAQSCFTRKEIQVNGALRTFRRNHSLLRRWGKKAFGKNI